MKPQETRTGQRDLFSPCLSNVLPPDHPLVRLGQAIDWPMLEEKFGNLFTCQKGRPAAPVRLVVGLMMLQHLHGFSDERVVKMWGENYVWQAFCGYDTLQLRCPVHATVLVRWRQKMKETGLITILQQTLAAAQQLGVLKSKELEEVIADTTVMPKAVAFPTDTALLNKAREKLVQLCRKVEIQLRQSYVRKSKSIVQQAYRLAKARQGKKLQRCVRKLKTMLGSVLRQVRIRIEGNKTLQKQFESIMQLCEQLMSQEKNSKNKLYSLHAPEVECIAKGKLHKRYEFGCKVGLVVTHRQGFVLSSQALHGLPYDGHTLQKSLDDAQSNTDVPAQRACVDRGYRKHGVESTQVLMSGQRGLSRRLKKFVRRRSSIEPRIGHMKSDGKLDRNWLKGKLGDCMQAILCAIGQNLRLILNALPCPKSFW